MKLLVADEGGFSIEIREGFWAFNPLIEGIAGYVHTRPRILLAEEAEEFAQDILIAVEHAKAIPDRETEAA